MVPLTTTVTLAAAKTATVQRGYLGSTAATHATDALVYVNSKFPTFSIFQALNADLADLCAPSNGLLQVISLETNYNPVVQGYDITGATQILDILAVRAKIVGPSKDWVPITSYRLDQGADTTVFPSGFSITLFQGGNAGLPIQITYSAPFTPFTALTTTTAAVGLADTMTDIPPLGAGMRLTGVREVQRNFNESQGDTRRASEVPPNAQLAGYQALARERQRRVRAESNRIASNWPLFRQGI